MLPLTGRVTILPSLRGGNMDTKMTHAARAADCVAFWPLGEVQEVGSRLGNIFDEAFGNIIT